MDTSTAPRPDPVGAPVGSPTPSSVPGPPPATSPRPGSAPVVHLEGWLVARRNGGATPDELAAELVAAGWSADHAARAALRSLRRADRRALLWFSLCWSAGLAAVGLTTALHELLAEFPDRGWAALALTVSVVMAPIAAVCAVLAHRSEAASPFAVWSPERRFWFGTLAACTAVVGLVRLVGYVYVVIASLVSASPEPLYARDLAQVMVTLAVALPLFWWSFTGWRRSDVAISGLRDDAGRPVR